MHQNIYLTISSVTESSPNIDLTHSERKKHSGEQGMYHLYQVDSIKMIKSSDHSPHQKYLTNPINTFIISTEVALKRPLTFDDHPIPTIQHILLYNTPEGTLWL